MKKLVTALSCAAMVLPGTAEEFLPSGKMTIGVNYWASHAATQMWRKWDAKTVERDFRLLASHGVKILRVFPLWPDFQPIRVMHAGSIYSTFETRMFESEEHRPDTPAGFAGVDEKMMEHFDEFCALAEKYQLKLIVCIMTGQMTFRIFVPPALENRNLYTDGYALKWEERFIDYFVRRTKHHKAIAAWESGNESRVLGNLPDRETGEVWLRNVHNIIRLADPSRPVIGVDGLVLNPQHAWESRMVATLSDCCAVHPYNMWSKAGIEEFNGIRNLLYCAALCAPLAQVTNKPSFVEEHGLWRPVGTNYTDLAKYQRGLLWNLYASNCRAMLWWCAFDQSSFDTAPYDWHQPGLEHGLFTESGTPRPGMLAMQKFSAFLQTLPFAQLPQAKPDALFITPDVDLVHSSYILARQAGIMPEYQSPAEKIRKASCYFLPSVNSRALLTTRRWEELLHEVRDEGATLYLANDDTFLTHLDELCGAELVWRKEQGGKLDCKGKDFRFSLPVTKTSRFRATTAKVLAADAEGNPLLFQNKYGKGTVYFLTFPLEKQLYAGVGLYAGDAWKIYQTVLPRPQLVRTGNPMVTASEHFFSADKAAVILVNNQMENHEGKLQIAENWRITAALSDTPSEAKYADGKLSMAMNTGILLILEKER